MSEPHSHHHSIAHWLQSTSLAQQRDADDYSDNGDGDDARNALDKPHANLHVYACTADSPDMAAATSTSSPAVRSASGPASVSPGAATKVKALALQFDSAGAATSPSSLAARSRLREPTRAGAPDAARRLLPAASPARPSRQPQQPHSQASYGHYTFTNLKPRERPQPAPATPPRAHRAHASRGSLDHHTAPARSRLSSPTRPRPASSSSSGHAPLFGEVVSHLPRPGPGFGIPSAAPLLSQDATSQPHKHPHSKIPVAARRLSITSDSSSSTSVKYTPTRAAPHSNTASPTRMNRNPLAPAAAVPALVPAARRPLDQSTLPAVAYLGQREQDRTTAAGGTRTGPTVPALVTAPPPPTSPRLRNSRERQPLQPSSSPRPRSSGPHGEYGYFPAGDALDVTHIAQTIHDEPIVAQDGFHGRHADSHYNRDAVHASHPSPPQQRLSLQTASLSQPPPHDPTSAFTEFDESPVLGIPGSFVMTPPLASHQDPEQQNLLQPLVYHRPPKATRYQPSDIEQSELGVRESIPIMLGVEQAAQPRAPASERLHDLLEPPSYAHEQADAASYEPNDPLINPHYSRATLYPDDSASSAPHRADRSPITFDPETYSVVNSVLNLYHQSQTISPELAVLSKERVQQVSPIVAQHNEWASKEATETFLARLLSDASATSDEPPKLQASQTDVGNLDIPHTTQHVSESGPTGTVIVFPSQSRRYSRGSGGSSAATTIQENASHSGSSSGNPSQDSLSWSATLDQASTPTTSIDLPQLAWAHGGLGLSLHSVPSHSPPAHYAPPRPAYSPPPPPVPASIEQQATSSSPRPSSRAPTIDNQLEMHPARARTPVVQTPEQSLEDRYGTPQPVEADHLMTMPSAGEKSQSGHPDTTHQALVRRYRILEELLTTEHQFCIDMMIAHNIFEATAQNLMSEKEKKLLFSNCKELEKFSLSLFRSFKRAAKPIVNYEIPPPTGPWNRDPSDTRPYKTPESSLALRSPSEDAENQFENCTPDNDHLTTIGRVFLDNKEKMERLYTTYFLNQDNASAYIKKNQNNPELAGWVVACFEQVENMTQAWDLDSLLLKPCQRLLKYPLLLEGLANASDPAHPDLQNIVDARKELLAINARINDAKARSDTFRAAASEGKKEKGRGKGIGKTFVKAFIPKPDKSKAYDEADKAFKDQEYKSREQKFGGHFFQLQIVIRDFEQYLDSVTEHYLQLNIVFLGFITVCEVAPSIYPEIESTWRKWAMAHFELQNKALEEHKVAVRSRVLKPVGDLWEMWVSYQKTIEQRKKYLLYYVKYKQMVDRGEKVDPELEDLAQKFTAINDTLKHELPLLYERTKGLMRTLMTLFMCLQKDWYKTCSKKILPLLESEPQHTTSLRYDLDSYVERFHADYKPMQDLANRLGIVNRSLLVDISNMTSPVPTVSDDGGSSRNSSSRRTASVGSEASMQDSRPRNSGGYGTRSHPRIIDNPPRSTPTGPAYPSLYQVGSAGRSGPGPTSLREARALSPVSDNSEATVMHGSECRNPDSSRHQDYYVLDGVVDFDDPSPFGSGTFDFPPQLGASFLSSTMQTTSHSMPTPTSQLISLPDSSRASGVFNSALPMSDSPVRGSMEDLPTTPADTDEPEVLFLAASLFEFNIAHDRREGGIPYLVYVPGEIFDVIGMKGELWLARNQDDSTKTVGWIWEKHFARILPEDA